MATQVQVINLALGKLGGYTITSLTENTDERIACTNIWDTVRDQLLTIIPWNFAMTRAELAQLADDPAFEFDYQYQLPTGCLRVWELYGSDAEWVREGNYLLTDDDETYIRYISQVTDVTKFSPSFVTCMALAIAAEICVRLTGNKTKKAELLEELEKIALPRAAKLNALEGNPRRHTDEQPLDEGNFTWQTEGR